ncbi:uncharacterized protein LTHEOB_180 [Lasiodiplodia theobromae]|uniref:uncharacterized protein n=1 Tax=Lasiodiplodia theobromae TaxID=45133 RepID=UPI0015C38CD9|nr:uncharacterized protein LTHEOB_180 [Lasiodiplodia theobromae]KAF4543481.1 hypothetical protein LTHEOB_180 [Lasiodiplodia theobromae]
MDQTHEPDEHLFDDNMDLSGLPHGDLLPDTTHDPAWEPDYDSYELPDAAPPSYEESTSGGGGGGIDRDPSTLTATDPQTFFSPTASSQPQPVPQQPRPARPRLRRVLARISSSSPPSPPLPPVTTYSSAHSPPRQAVHDRTSTSTTSESPDSVDGGVPLDPTATTATATVPALICHHAVPLPAAASGLPIPPRCPPCTTVMHRAYTLQMKMEWDLARLDPDTSHAERSAACRAYFRARADEQNYQDELEDGGRAEEALREAAARRHRGAQRAVFFEAGTPLVSRGRAAGAFKRESRGYVPGKWAGEWEDTSGMRQSFSEYYDVMADYDEEAIVDDDDEEDYYDEDEEMCDDEDDDEEDYKYYDEGYAAGME